MVKRKSYRQKKPRESNGRLNIVLAIIFLMSGWLIAKLFILQIFSYDLYSALASDQHLVYNQLKPERGRIYIQDRNNGQQELFPLAMSKDFALVYAIPGKIENPEDISGKLYEIFDQTDTEDEVEGLLESDENFNLGKIEELPAAERKEREEFRKIKKELEIEIRREAVVAAYLEKLNKKNDPYEPIRNKVDDETLEKVLALESPGLDYITEKHRYYPEDNIGSHLTGFVGFAGDEKSGQYGLEGFFDEELTGRTGTLRAERSAKGGTLIVNDWEYKKETDGSDLVLTINRSIQFFACRKLNETALRHGATGGSVLIMEPFTGAIMAMCSWPDYDPNNYNEVEDINIFNNPAIFDAYEPGSIFKVFTMAAGLDKGVISPQSIYNDNGFVMVEGWPKPIKNSDFETHGPYGWVNMVTVLTESLNTGTIFVEQKVGDQAFADYVKRFGFGEKTGVELETEGLTNIENLKRKRFRPVETATASFGQGITATPLQVISAYAAISNGGILIKPYVVDEIIPPHGEPQKTSPQQIRRVITDKTSLLLSGMMVNVVDGGHAKRAGVSGYYVAGKTGTAQVADQEKGGYGDATIHTFVGFAPVEEPRFVMLVKLDDPKSVEFAASSAAPLFGEIAEFILNYFQVAKER